MKRKIPVLLLSIMMLLTLLIQPVGAGVESPVPGNQDLQLNSHYSNQYHPDNLPDALTEDEEELAILINEYRQSLGLEPLTVSRSLTKVARYHVYDVINHVDLELKDYRGIKGNLHSWSDKGPWQQVIYTPDHYYAELMWSKPRELTNYRGNGFEISYYRSSGATPEAALNGWRFSNAHNNVITGVGYWENLVTMGIGIHGNYSHVWFGKEEDPDGYYTIDSSNKE